MRIDLNNIDTDIDLDDEDEKTYLLAYYLSSPVEELSGYTYRADDGEEESDYLVMTDEEADKEAVNWHISMIEDLGAEYFSKSFLKRVIDKGYVNKSWFEEWLEEENDYLESEGEEHVETDDPIEYFKDVYGNDEFERVIIDNNLLDAEMIAKNIIAEDGRGSALAGYDGEEIYLGADSHGEDIYAYKI